MELLFWLALYYIIGVVAATVCVAYYNAAIKDVIMKSVVIMSWCVPMYFAFSYVIQTILDIGNSFYDWLYDKFESMNKH